MVIEESDLDIGLDVETCENNPTTQAKECGNQAHQTHAIVKQERAVKRRICNFKQRMGERRRVYDLASWN